jgi:hypothetical protein
MGRATDAVAHGGGSVATITEVLSRRAIFATSRRLGEKSKKSVQKTLVRRGNEPMFRTAQIARACGRVSVDGVRTRGL